MKPYRRHSEITHEPNYRSTRKLGRCSACGDYKEYPFLRIFHSGSRVKTSICIDCIIDVYSDLDILGRYFKSLWIAGQVFATPEDIDEIRRNFIDTTKTG